MHNFNDPLEEALLYRDTPRQMHVLTGHHSIDRPFKMWEAAQDLTDGYINKSMPDTLITRMTTPKER